jgi:HEAT repeat protein
MILAEGLARPEPDIVRTCCQAIGHLRSTSAVPALETATQHGDPEVREAAIEALSQIRGAKGA